MSKFTTWTNSTRFKPLFVLIMIILFLQLMENYYYIRTIKKQYTNVSLTKTMFNTCILLVIFNLINYSYQNTYFIYGI